MLLGCGLNTNDDSKNKNWMDKISRVFGGALLKKAVVENKRKNLSVCVRWAMMCGNGHGLLNKDEMAVLRTPERGMCGLNYIEKKSSPRFSDLLSLEGTWNRPAKVNGVRCCVLGYRT